MKNFIPNTGLSVPYDKPVYEELLYDVIELDGIEHTCIHSDSYLLFNQKRLDSLGKDSAKFALEQMTNLKGKNDGISSDGISDADLLASTPSRHIQSVGELKNYAYAMSNATKSINDKLEFDKQYAEECRKNDELIEAYRNGLNQKP